MKKVLIITYHFPPDAAVGAIRPAKFAKFLPEFGWEPIVYTVKEKYYGVCDYTKFEPALETIKIYRAKLIPGPLHIYSHLFHTKNNSYSVSPGSQPVKKIRQDAVGSLKRFFSSMLRLPDDKQGWIFNILLNGYRIMRKHKIDTFITSGPPMSTHIGGLLLKSMTQAKWIADFRDPWWTGNHWKKEYYYRTQVSDSLERRLESRVIRKADVVVSTAANLTEYFKLASSGHQKDKFLTITNGFDEGDFPGVRNNFSLHEPKILISHAGTLYFNRDPEPFFKVLSDLIKKRKVNKQDIEIHLIGDCRQYKGGSVKGLIDHYELSPIVKLLGVMPFDKTLERLTSSDALFLLAQGQPDQIPGKVFEYLRINKPIFAITEEGETKRILEEFENTFIADPAEEDDIAQKFLEMLKAIKNGSTYFDSLEKIKKYDRRHLTEKLARSLDGISNLL